MSQSTPTPTPLSPAPFPTSAPRELVDNTTFLLKKLGFGVKERSLEAYRESGLTPQHHAVMSLLEEERVARRG